MLTDLIEDFNCVFSGLASIEIKEKCLVIKIGDRELEISLPEVTSARH